MKVRGTVRSLDAWENDGSGPTASVAREAATTGLPDDYELIDVQTVTAKPGEPVTMRAMARSTRTETIEAEGRDQAEALAALRAAVPEGMRLLGHVVL